MTILYIQFALYLVMMLAIGYISMKRTKTNEDFIIGGRTIGPRYIGYFGGCFGYVQLAAPGGSPALFLPRGLSEGVWICLGLLIGAYFNWLIVAGRLRVMTDKLDAVTLPSFFAPSVLKTIRISLKWFQPWLSSFSLPFM